MKSQLIPGLLASSALALIVGCGKPSSEMNLSSSEDTLPQNYTLPLQLPLGAKALELMRIPGNETIQPFLIGNQPLLPRHLARGRVQAKRVRPLRSGRQRVGMVRRLV